MQTLRHDRKAIDATTLGAILRERKSLEEVGGFGYIAELAANVPTAANIGYYAQIVRDRGLARSVATKATQLASLAYDGVSAEALLGEFERIMPTIQPNAHNRLPQLIERDIEILSGQEFAERHTNRETRHWIVEGFLARKEISLWSGKVEAGKTSLMRTLVMSIARGDFFLERHVYPSKILYVMLDADGEDLTFEEFKTLGWDPQRDEIDFLIDPVMALRANSFEQFHARVLELKPQFIVIDPLGRFQKIADFLGYETTYAMAQFSELAKRTDTHIALLHHIPRGRGDSDDPATAGFGSIAIAGGCNARFVCTRKQGGVYTLQTSKGKGGGFRPFDGEQVLDMDPETHRITLRGAFDWKDEARACEAMVLKFVNEYGQHEEEPVTAQLLGKELHIKRSIAGAAAKSLVHRGELKLTIGKANRHIFTPVEAQGQLVE